MPTTKSALHTPPRANWEGPPAYPTTSDLITPTTKKTSDQHHLLSAFAKPAKKKIRVKHQLTPAKQSAYDKKVMSTYSKTFNPDRSAIRSTHEHGKFKHSHLHTKTIDPIHHHPPLSETEYAQSMGQAHDLPSVVSLLKQVLENLIKTIPSHKRLHLKQHCFHVEKQIFAR